MLMRRSIERCSDHYLFIFCIQLSILLLVPVVFLFACVLLLHVIFLVPQPRPQLMPHLGDNLGATPQFPSINNASSATAYPSYTATLLQTLTSTTTATTSLPSMPTTQHDDVRVIESTGFIPRSKTSCRRCGFSCCGGCCFMQRDGICRRGSCIIKSNSTQPVTTQPVTTQPVTTQPVTTQPVTKQPPGHIPNKTSRQFAEQILLVVVFGMIFIFFIFAPLLSWALRSLHIIPNW